MKCLIPQSIKNIYHLFQAILANVWFGFPSRRLKIIGVTGTNGKTTTCQMISRILEENGFKVAIASTINFKIGEKEWVNETKFTTLSSWKLQKHLWDAAKAGCEYAIVEVTSHALDQNRVWGVDFSVAVITNITREHLDYHKTMENYAKAKEKLFQMIARKRGGIAVVNLEMDFADNFLKQDTVEKFGYAIEHPNVKIQLSDQNATSLAGGKNPSVNTIIAEEIELGINNSKFKITSLPAGGQNTKFLLNLPGQFNIENALAATCVGLSQGVSLEKISVALENIKGVPGRVEYVRNNRGIEIIVDYAVTPDSLEKLYGYLGGLKTDGTRIISVFGSCGERDRGKRPIMGETVARHADFCIVTNEDPYGEDPQQIIDEVFFGVTEHKKENKDAWRIIDRREAIKKALEIARAGDIVVVTGKGAEEMMAVGGKMIPWNDPKVIREVLQEGV